MTAETEGAAPDANKNATHVEGAAEAAVPADVRLRDIRARAEAATRGPWVVDRNDDPDERHDLRIRCEYGKDGTWPAGKGVVGWDLAYLAWGDRREANAPFIAHAREDIPWLLGRLAASAATEPQARPTETTSSPAAPLAGPADPAEDEIAALVEAFDADLPLDAPSLRRLVRHYRGRKDDAYTERNRCVALLAALFPSSLERHPDSDATWEDDWRWVVYIDLPAGQVSWHMHDSQVWLFDHVRRFQSRAWDGHTTEEKYRRVARAATEPQARPNETKPSAVADPEALRGALREACDVLEAWTNSHVTAPATLKVIARWRAALSGDLGGTRKSEKGSDGLA